MLGPATAEVFTKRNSDRAPSMPSTDIRTRIPVEVPRHASAPLKCPFCASEAIAATTQKVTAETYWRCETCGQLWHPERLRAQWEYGGHPPRRGRAG